MNNINIKNIIARYQANGWDIVVRAARVVLIASTLAAILGTGAMVAIQPTLTTMDKATVKEWQTDAKTRVASDISEINSLADVRTKSAVTRYNAAHSRYDLRGKKYSHKIGKEEAQERIDAAQSCDVGAVADQVNKNLPSHVQAVAIVEQWVSFGYYIFAAIMAAVLVAVGAWNFIEDAKSLRRANMSVLRCRIDVAGIVAAQEELGEVFVSAFDAAENLMASAVTAEKELVPEVRIDEFLAALDARIELAGSIEQNVQVLGR